MFDSVQLGVMLAESGLLDEAVREVMLKPQLMMMAESSADIKSAMKGQLSKWRGQLQQQLSRVPQEQRFAKEIQQYQLAIEMDAVDFALHVDDIVEGLAEHSPFYLEAKKLTEDGRRRLSPMFQSYFCNRWFESLLLSLKEAQLHELEQSKQALLEDLYQRAETLQELAELQQQGDWRKVGRLWDMAACKLTKREHKQLLRVARFLKERKGLQEIAESIGRRASEQQPADHQQACEEQLSLQQEQSQSCNDDIVGIHESDDISKLLPSETLFLAYPELEVVFYKHLVDKRLLNYQQQGKQHSLSKVATEKVDIGPPQLPKGPFVLAIDCSGSMQGFPERCAKALAYGLMEIALAEKRDCYVMLFSSELICYELTRQDGLREALSFLSYSFHGGTDINKLLAAAIEQFQQQRYLNADLLVLSDFIAPAPPESLLGDVTQIKQSENRFHAVNLSRYGNPSLMTIFDEVWDYHNHLTKNLVKRFSSAS
ncbi:ATPase RavA stimulator ViaA [Aliagarivorans marinus]|uniref:ATPase RavA stimulator ViaA n=1 Tax=Aliagarivorans marinus TaxID=561965 RepID=UPI00040C425A|nr:ATPase RavA stimulator ViaA [Aliagarivorans marinus]